MDFKTRETDINIKLAKWASCGCCEKHDRDKPTVWGAWKELPFHGTHLQKGECECDCRHKARILCRMHKGSDEGWMEVASMVAKAKSLLPEEEYVYPDPREEAKLSRPRRAHSEKLLTDEQKFYLFGAPMAAGLLEARTTTEIKAATGAEFEGSAADHYDKLSARERRAKDSNKSACARRCSPLVPGKTRWCNVRQYVAKDILECCGCCHNETCKVGCACWVARVPWDKS